MKNNFFINKFDLFDIWQTYCSGIELIVHQILLKSVENWQSYDQKKKVKNIGPVGQNAQLAFAFPCF